MFFAVLFFVAFQMSFAVFGRAFRSQRFFVHFIRDGVGFFRGALMIVFVICFVILFRVGFLIGVLIFVQGFLQLFQFRGLHERFGPGFDGFGPVLGVSLRFFVLGFDQLLGERVCLIVGKGRSIGRDWLPLSPHGRLRLPERKRMRAISVSASVRRGSRVFGNAGG